VAGQASEILCSLLAGCSRVQLATQAAEILLRCTEPGWAPGWEGIADLSELRDLRGLALDQWLGAEENEQFKHQVCEGLRSLNLNGIVGIDKLPRVIGNFSQLTSISLLGTNLKSFPPELLDRATSLRHLALGRQTPEFKLSIKEAPPPFDQFKFLTELILEAIGLTELPTSCSIEGPWPSLKKLSLRNNELTHLPVWLTALSQLESLDVSGNMLTALPPFQEYQPLVSLNLKGNCLMHLPTSLVVLKRTLRDLDANPQRGGVPLKVPPEEVLAKSAEAVLSFLDDLQRTGQQTRTLMRVSFIGEGGAGKTHLCLALQDELERYRSDDPETVGIDMGKWVAQSGDRSKPSVYCRAWDFAGSYTSQFDLPVSAAHIPDSLK
jgi:hypothetical protein